MPPTAIVFRQMTADEFGRYLEKAIPEYADMHLRAGNVVPENSLKRAQEDYASLLPQGLATPGHHLFAVTAADGGASLGMCWFEIKQRAGRTKAFIYDFYLEEAQRGKGLGRQFMDELEQRAAALGAVSIGLHVFGDNLSARALYEKCGYRYADMQMTKDLPKTTRHSRTISFLLKESLTE